MLAHFLIQLILTDSPVQLASLKRRSAPRVSLPGSSSNLSIESETLNRSTRNASNALISKNRRKEENPYVFLSECLSRAVIEPRPDSVISHASSRTSNRSSLGRQLSVPDESPPPPPEGFRDGSEDSSPDGQPLYKEPVKIVVYEPAATKARKSSLTLDFVGADSALQTTYDVPKLSNGTLRTSYRKIEPVAEDNYDHVRAVPLSSVVDVSPRSERGASVPTDNGTIYDQVIYPIFHALKNIHNFDQKSF